MSKVTVLREYVCTMVIIKTRRILAQFITIITTQHWGDTSGAS